MTITLSLGAVGPAGLVRVVAGARPAAATPLAAQVQPSTTTAPGDTAPTTTAGGLTTAATETERLDDPETRHTINLLTGVLLGLAVVVLALTVWFWRTTRPVPAALEPLAAMSSRRFRRQSPAEREREVHALHELKAATDPPPRAADFLRQVRGEDG